MGMRIRRHGRWVLALPLIVAVACSSVDAPTPTAARSSPAEAALAASSTARIAGPAHIVVIALENHEYGDIVGAAAAPYLNGLAARSVLLSRGYAVGHPSLPNYLSLTGGSTFGVTTDCASCSVSRRNLVDQLAAHHLSWKAYMQGMPRPCFTGTYAGRGLHLYAKRHDPFLYFDDIRNRPARCARVVPLGQLHHDLQHTLPRFAWITPDLCFDMHSCSVRTGDAWLHAWVPAIVRHLGPTGILVIVFDEGSTDARCCSLPAGGGHVMALIAGPGARRGVQVQRATDHYSILRLIDDAWGLSRLGHAADARTPTIWGWKP